MRYRVILNQLWNSGDYSKHFRSKIYKAGYTDLERWFATADGICMPFCLYPEVFTYQEVDKLTKFALENCTNNFAQFIRRLKKSKKLFRKGFYTSTDLTVGLRDMKTYLDMCRKFVRRIGGKDPHKRLQAVLFVTQTRATGLADSAMMAESERKFEEVITSPSIPVILDQARLFQCMVKFRRIDPASMKISCGPSSCFEKTREEGGQTAFIKDLVRTRCLHREYNLDTLEYTKVAPRPVRNPADIISLAIDQYLHHRWKFSVVRVHTVAEPSKARIITVRSYFYSAIMHCVAHAFAPCIRDKHLVSGMTKSRHLWNFGYRNLNPHEGRSWTYLDPGNVWGLSTDLETATDYGNMSVSKEIWRALTIMGVAHGLPRGLLIIAKTLYNGNMFAIMKDGRLVKRTRGWMMGDPFTKVLLTIAEDYAYRVCQSPGSCVGDDVVRLGTREVCEAHLLELRRMDFRISEDDTFISKIGVFYCEEGMIIPQYEADTIASCLKGGRAPPYIDYPRIRLLLDVHLETDSFSYTRAGKFSLLGKEARWVSSLSAKLLPMYTRAIIGQNIWLPQDNTCYCPFLPEILGGNGSFLNDPETILMMMDKVPRSREMHFRVEQNYSKTCIGKYTQTTREVSFVNRSSWIVNTDQVSQFIPEEWIVRPKSQTERKLLGSLRCLTTPINAIMNIAQRIYYNDLFSGREPRKLSLPIPEVDIGRTNVRTSIEHLSILLNRWRSPGLSPEEEENFFIDTQVMSKERYLNLGLKPRMRPFKDTRERDEWEEYARNNLLIRDRVPDEALPQLRWENYNIPHEFRDRIHLFMESDSWIIAQLDQRKTSELHQYYVLVSGDLKLAQRIGDLLYARGYSKPLIFVVKPVFYTSGMFYEAPPYSGESVQDMDVIEDPGAISWADYQHDNDPIDLDGEFYWRRDGRYNRIMILSTRRGEGDTGHRLLQIDGAFIEYYE